MSFASKVQAKYVVAEHDDEEQELEESDDDIYITPAGKLGSMLSLSAEGKFIGEFSEDEDVQEAIVEWMNKNKFYPSIWFVSDHGNVSPYKLDDKYQRMVRAKYLVGAASAQSKDVPYKEYATHGFIKVVKDIKANNMLNMHVEEVLNKKVTSKLLEKEIKKAIKAHSKWGKQPGASALHAGVTMAMWRLLEALYKETKKVNTSNDV